MKASYQWLRALVPQVVDSPADVAARLTSVGLEVEGTEVFGAGAAACIVAAVVSARPHPEKSGLRLVTVDRGGSQIEVICGAPNVPEAGGLVVLAPLGAHLPAKGMTIERRTIAGVTSEGMLCSEQELGLTDQGEGILVLPPGSARLGAPFGEAVPSAHDTVFEIGLTPNRPDGLGHIGLARDLAAAYGVPFSVPGPELPARTDEGRVQEQVTVSIEDAEGCPHYGAAIVTGVTVGPSPLPIRYRLAALGVRPISNLVDVTNLAMLEYGHPLHAFDLDRLRGNRIVVRKARAGEKLITLDGVSRTLDPDDLVVCDAGGPVALAGVMGGAESEISATTRRVLLECAYFDPRTVRRTARRHGLHTDASHRFERGVDHGDTSDVLAHAAGLATRVAGGAALTSPAITTGRTLERFSVELRSSRMQTLLGLDVPFEDALGILRRLGFEVRTTSATSAECLVPTHRPDIAREVDLIDEVLRVRGLDAVPPVLPRIPPTRDVGEAEELARRARAAGAGLGLSEAVTLAFTSPRALQAVGAPPPTVVLKNPLAETQSVMRTSLLPGVLEAIARAQRHGERDARMFTVGRVYLGEGQGALPREPLGIAAVLAGDRPAYLRKADAIDVWDAKGLALGLVQRFAGRDAEVRALQGAARPAHLHPRGAATVVVDGTPVGTFGLLHPDASDALDLTGPLAVCELELELLARLARVAPRHRPLPRFPAATRDLALVVREEVPAGEVERAVREAAGDLAAHVELFDRFVSAALPEHHASLAFHVVYRAADRTLTDAEIDLRHGRVVAELGARFGATLRA